MIHDAMKVAYSSIVGQSIMLLNDKGACIGQLSVINCENPQEIADEVVAALKAPNRHAYQVGVKVGKTVQKEILSDEYMRLYNEDVDRLCAQGWKRLDAEREVWRNHLARATQKEND